MSDESPPPVQVFLKGLDGVTAKYDLPLSTLVLEFTAIVSKDTGIPADEIRLVYSGNQLADVNTLSESGVLSKVSTMHMVLRLKGGGRKPFVSKYSRAELNKMQEDRDFQVNLVQRRADGLMDDDNESLDLYSSQCITAKRNRRKTGRSMKQAGQPARKSRSIMLKIEAEMAASGLNPVPKKRRPRKSAAKAKAAITVEYASPPSDSDSDVEIVGQPKVLPPPDVDGAAAALAAFTMETSS